MNKFWKIFLCFLIIFSSVSVGTSSWIITQTKAENQTEIKKDDVTKLTCYNKQTGRKYFNLNKAVTEASQSTNKQDIYVMPGSTIEVTSSITIPSNITVIMPYENETYNITDEASVPEAGALGDNGASAVKTNRASLLNLRNGADLIVDGSLIVGGFFSAYGVKNKYAEINLGEGSSITVNGALTCFGYIKEEANTAKNSGQSAYKNYRNNEFDSGRNVLINSSAKLTTSISIFDLKSGGPLTTLINQNICPFNHLNFTNIQTYLELKSGVIYDVEGHLTISGQKALQRINCIRPGSSKDAALYYINSGSLCFEYCPINPSYTSINDKLNIFIKGDINQGFLKISKSIITISTENFFLPMSEYFNIFILNGGVFNTNYKIKFLTGSSLIIDKNGTLNLNSQMIAYDKDSINLQNIINDTYCNHLLNKPSAVFINNGTLNIKANSALGASIETTSNDDTAKIVFDPNCQTEVISKEGVSATSIKITSGGLFKDDASSTGKSFSQFNKGTTIKSDAGGKQCWIGEMIKIIKLSITIDTTGKTDTLVNYRIYVADSNTGTNQTELTTESMQVGGNFEITNGKFFKIAFTDFNSATFTTYPTGESALFDTNKWYAATGDYALKVIPISSVTIQFTTNSFSGAGSTEFTLSTSTEQNGTYTALPVQGGGKGSFKIREGLWFKASCKLGTYNFLDWKEVHIETRTISKGPADLLNTQFKENTPYLASESFKIDFILNGTPAGCLAEGTKILLDDGTYKPIENITQKDKVLMFNHETGKYESSNILAIVNHGYHKNTLINLSFDNGSNLTVVTNHELFDTTLMEYVEINSDNVENYTNHKFAIYNDEKVSYTKLLSSSIRTEFCNSYTIVSYGHMNTIANGLITFPSDLYGLNDYFEYNEDLSWNRKAMLKDIEKYGLYTYDDWKDKVPLYMFEGYNFKYFKVSIGKGLMTYEDVLNYIEYSNSLIEDNEMTYPK